MRSIFTDEALGISLKGKNGIQLFDYSLPEACSHVNTYVYCQVNGGREGRPIGAYELAKAVEELGAGEILLNCIDCDGKFNFASFNYI